MPAHNPGTLEKLAIRLRAVQRLATLPSRVKCRLSGGILTLCNFYQMSQLRTKSLELGWDSAGLIP